MALKQLTEFLRTAVNDTTLSTAARKNAYEGAGNPSWIDWAPFLAGTDPLASELVGEAWGQKSDDVRSEPLDEEQKSAIYRAAATSPQGRVRRVFAASYPLERDDVLEVFKKLFQDADASVRNNACVRLATISRADAGPLFVPLLRDPNVDVRLSAIAASKRFATPTAIESLVPLLDDESIGVRDQTLDALKAIRDRLKEKREWQDLIRTLKR